MVSKRTLGTWEGWQAWFNVLIYSSWIVPSLLILIKSTNHITNVNQKRAKQKQNLSFSEKIKNLVFILFANIYPLFYI